MIVGSVLNRVTINSKCSIKEAMKTINDNAMKLALVINNEGVLIGVVTDGDVRRGLLRGLLLESAVEQVMNSTPIVAQQIDSLANIFKLMMQNDINHIPIVDINGKLIGLHVRNEKNKVLRDNFFVIMAGGLGTRLLPYTKDCPKPMLPINGKPILEKIIIRAKEQGFYNFLISVNYLSHIIQDYFGDGSKFNIKISYVEEKNRLGTIGALSLCKEMLNTPFIVTNGDILSDINYEHLLDFHIKNEFFGTMAVKLHEIQNPYGVVFIDGHTLVGFEEKPIYRNYINAGVYALSPHILKFLKRNEYCDTPSLLKSIISQFPKKTAVYIMEEEWVDIGRPEDYNNANNKLIV